MQITFELGSGFTQAISDITATGDKIKQAVGDGMRSGVKQVASMVSKNYLSGQSLKSRTGNLRRAVDGWMEKEFEGVIGVAPQSAVEKYKWILGDETKTITAKKSKFLAIPIGAALTPSGVARYSSPRQISDGFFFKTLQGQLMFGRNKGKQNQRIEPLFLLVKSVKITGSGALAKGVLDNTNMISDAITDKLK